jgi:O-antigen/teichoic acid export membrane protein
MPNLLQPEQIGLVKLIGAVTGVFSSVFSFGVAQLLFRMYPVYEGDKVKRRKLLFLSLKIALAGSVVALPFFLITVDQFFNLSVITQGVEKGSLFLILVFLSIVARLFYASLFGYIRMMNDVVTDAFIQNVYHKLVTLVLLVILFFEVLNVNSFIYLSTAIYFLYPIIIGVRYMLKKDAIKPSEISFKNRDKSFSSAEQKEFFNLLLFGLLTTIGGSMYLYLDTLMVNHYLGEFEVGIYGTMFLFGIVVIIPARSLKSIAVSILSRSFKDNDMENVATVYKKSSITLLIVGGYLFLGIWCNLYTVFTVLPKVFELGKYVVFFIGLAQVIDMMAGVNNELNSASPKYRWNTWFTLMAIVVGLIINILLIPKYGMNGAAIATFSTIVMINLIRLLTVYKLYYIQPFTLNTLKVVLLLVGVGVIVSNLPNIENSLINLIYKGGLITVLYFPLVYILKVSDDVNEMIDKVLIALRLKS